MVLSCLLQPALKHIEGAAVRLHPLRTVAIAGDLAHRRPRPPSVEKPTVPILSSCRPATALLALAALLPACAFSQQLVEDFNMPGTTLPSPNLPAGWIARNQSATPSINPNLANCFHTAALGGVGTGVNSWPPFEGGGMAYATFACTLTSAVSNALSGFLISPQLDELANGVEITFQTRGDTLTGATRPDRLQVLLCLGATCGDAGSTGSSPTDLGQFSNVLLDINPEQVNGVFPLTWTQQTATISGLPEGSHSGRFAFRFVAPDGSASGTQGSRIGIDSVNVSDAPPPTGGTSGWSNDPANNLMIADRNGEETQAKVLPRADGGFYVSWFDNTDGGYDVRLQRLDADGVELWPHNGIVVADRSYSSTTDYGFAVDIEGNALLSFQCCTQDAADERIVAVKVSPSGELLWGANGIPVSTLGEGTRVSYIAATSDGNSVVTWSNGTYQGRAQKLDASGGTLWGSTGIIISGPATGARFMADVKPALNGDAIVSWSNQVGSTRLLYAQKLASADGAALWGSNGVRASDAGNLQSGYFPKIIVDGAGGAVFGYYDVTGVLIKVRAQHLDASGARLLGNEGVLASTDISRNHHAPSASYDVDTGDIYLAWDDSQITTPNIYSGLYAQRIDAAGVRQYGDEGMAVVPMTQSNDGSESITQATTSLAPGGVIVTWVAGNTSATENRITSVRLDESGDLVWNAPVRLKTSATKTSRLTTATSVLGYAAFVWTDATSNVPSTGNVRAQNLQYTSAFGDTIFRNGFDD